ncbi:lipoprotein [Streptomyces clavuligerus]|nr:lipoprotein [Streptomyces clavuligerus]ANW21728.1 hypothetical protein BB341_00020 [Streptomyces clavuligerus]MBY6301054.1 hypothetical protein [Streptomyces clavuligerus]QCS09142.1 hypothetical protein CRV15_00030 [Streptomyces clavuligerus]QPJ96936.1 hypothetical protein GE265_27820 [Streptomyces clavuligerus]QPL84477.1 hypothetical protein I3J07_00025 [Streptomyces clavuligerus]
MTRVPRRALMIAAVSAALLTGCSSAAEPDRSAADRQNGGSSDSATAGKEAEGDEAGLPKAAVTVGTASSPCRLPVTFRMPESWRPEAVSIDPSLGGPPQQGTVRLVCEIDAKPAGMVGFLRVWQGKGHNPRQALDAFLTEAHAEESRFRTVTPGTAAEAAAAGTATKAGKLDAVEVTYVSADPDLAERKKERALAVAAPRGTVVVLDLGGMDTAEHERMLPAFRLALETLRARP